MGQRLGRRRARLLVVVLAVDHDREAVARAPVHHLPDVQHAATRGVHEHAAPRDQEIHVAGGHAEGRQDHHVASPDVAVADDGIPLVGEDDDVHLPQARVDVRVVDDFAGEKDPAVGEALARFVGVFDRAIHAVAEAELPCELQPELTDGGFEPQRLQAIDDVAAIATR